MRGVSVHVGLALENAQLHREIVEKRRIEQELVLAREIQRNFHPNIPQSYGGVEISASSEMCEAVGDTSGDASVAATNVFLRRDGDWRLWLHHGSPVAQAEDGLG